MFNFQSGEAHSTMFSILRFSVSLLLLLMSLTVSAADGDFETALEAVRNMRVGWNLGNTFDSNSGDTLNMWIEHWTGRTPTDYETAWGQPVTKPELMAMLKEAGFNAVRIPVTWYPHMEAKFNFSSWENSIWYPSQDDIGTTVQAEWMQRVHEVVDYVVSQGMYCILNVHHDTGASNTAWLIADGDVYTQQRERYENVWKQIAEEFKDYDEHLLFEGYNEMLDVKRSWCFASFGSEGNYNSAIATSAYNGINSFAQSFVNAVRSTGGNNSQRNLVVCTYGACDGSGTWSSHLQDPLKEMKLPNDVVDGHLIFEVHSYPDVKNLSSAKSDVRTLISNWKTYLTAKGAPMIVGEWGTSTENAYANYRSNYLAFAQYFIEQTKASDIATFHWMGLTDGEHRSVPEFNQQDLVDAIIKGYYGEGGFSAIHSLPADDSGRVDIYSPSGVMLYRQVPRHAIPSLKKGIYVIGGKKYIQQ
ncbi:MAG: glycoside hydrolase family 5 protein [Prevotella sp.]|nr:glycoside hydrolase family 5 protein [Prevotella sp.]